MTADLPSLRVQSRDAALRATLREQSSTWSAVSHGLPSEDALGTLANLLVGDDQGKGLDMALDSGALEGLRGVLGSPLPSRGVAMAMVVLANGAKQGDRHRTELGKRFVPVLGEMLAPGGGGDGGDVRPFVLGALTELCEDHPGNVALLMSHPPVLACMRDWMVSKDQAPPPRVLSLAAKLCATCLAQIVGGGASSSLTVTAVLLLSLLSTWLSRQDTKDESDVITHVFHVVALVCKLSHTYQACVAADMVEATLAYLRRVPVAAPTPKEGSKDSEEDKERTEARLTALMVLARLLLVANANPTTPTSGGGGSSSAISRYCVNDGDLAPTLLSLLRTCNTALGDRPREGKDVMFYAQHRLLCLKCLSSLCADETRAGRLVDACAVHELVWHVPRTMHGFDVDGTREAIQVLRNLALARPRILATTLTHLTRVVLLHIVTCPDADAASASAAVLRLCARGDTLDLASWHALVDAEAIVRFVDPSSSKPLDRVPPFARAELGRFFSYVVAFGEAPLREDEDRAEALHNVVLVRHFVAFLLQSDHAELHAEALRALRSLPEGMTPMLKSIVLVEGVKLVTRLEQVKAGAPRVLPPRALEDLEVVLRRMR